MQQEISRHTSLGQSAEAILRRSADLRGADQLTLAIMRKWFWARKPDAGFLLTGFPATLLQAKVFDEWLDARGETLTSVLADPTVSAALPADDVVTHYRTQGLLDGVVCAAA